MRKSKSSPHCGVPKFLSVPSGHPFRSEELARRLCFALLTPAECAVEVAAMVANKALECLTSRQSPTIRHAWLDLEAEVALGGLKVESFLSDRTFYRRVAERRARMGRARSRFLLRLHGGSAALEAKVKGIISGYLTEPLWSKRT
ncbi:hypothetical protein [Rhizobium leguminosarum]|uniref:hypothetical protein n=1 Tax=Rhizobium leguminosarum TaxID=384 RepID=UPI0005185D90|nr:hypothetical protein [Rhizobium leguminosarum]